VAKTREEARVEEDARTRPVRHDADQHAHVRFGEPELRAWTDGILKAGPFEGRPPILSVSAGEPMPAVAEYYRRGLRVVAEPGTTFAYSNPGFATLGQIVEDVSGIALERYFRERIFEPLGMTDTDLIRSDRVASRLATGYTLGRHGVRAVPDRDWIGAASGGIYSTARDIARFAAALIGGANEHGSILEPATLSTMFEPHHQPDPRLPGWELGFARSEAGGHRLVGHDGILPGFNSTLLLAPDDGLAIVAFTNGSAEDAAHRCAGRAAGRRRRAIGHPA
jgi:CubicO group peptidase (beta-lactamase class C family)